MSIDQISVDSVQGTSAERAEEVHYDPEILSAVRELLSQPQRLKYLLEHPEDFPALLEEHRGQLQLSQLSPSGSFASSLVLNGTITPEIRLKLSEKIEEIHATRWAMAKLFGVSASTLHKWLTGQTTRCAVASRRKIMAFLNGTCDEILKETDSCTLMPYDESRLSLPARLCMEHILKIYELCDERPELENDFLNHMEQAAQKALKLLLSDGDKQAEDPEC